MNSLAKQSTGIRKDKFSNSLKLDQENNNSWEAVVLLGNRRTKGCLYSTIT